MGDRYQMSLRVGYSFPSVGMVTQEVSSILTLEVKFSIGAWWLIEGNFWQTCMLSLLKPFEARVSEEEIFLFTINSLLGLNRRIFRT